MAADNLPQAPASPVVAAILPQLRTSPVMAAAPPQPCASPVMVASNTKPPSCSTYPTGDLSDTNDENPHANDPQMNLDGRSGTDLCPRVGMVFKNRDVAFEFYKAYALKVGFGVRRRNANKGNDGAIISAVFCCHKEGHRGKDKRNEQVKKPRSETRVDCLARMGIRLHKGSGMYYVYDFVADHSHELHFQECAHLIRSHRQITDVQAQHIVLADNAGLTQRQQHDLCSVYAGGRENVGYTRLDVKNFLRTKRGREMEFGEAAHLLGYFQKRQILDPSFFHAIQLDSSEQITNIFWADSRMIIDYALFGDVVTFDTTFSTNKEYMPLGVFIGFNHHRELVVFGAALLYDETAPSFAWLFEIFLKAHKNLRPATIFTDQDAAMAKALGEVIPDVRHGLCTWHLMQNAMKNVGHLMKGGSHFLSDLQKLVYEYVDVEIFENAWNSLLTAYTASDNPWLKTLYKLKEKWARCYMKSTLTLGMRSTQLSESLNGDLKDYLKCSVNLDGFFKKFDKVVRDKRYKEMQAEFNAREKLPRICCVASPMLQQAAKVYTPTMFETFQSEWMDTCGLVIGECNVKGHMFEYVMTSFKGNEQVYTVTIERSSQEVSCNCNNFGTVGILCSHAIKILDLFNIKLIPDAYILKRWTRQARDGLLEKHGIDIQESGDMDATDRYRAVCPDLMKIADLSSQSVERHEYVKKMISVMMKTMVDEMPLRNETQANVISVSAENIPKRLSLKKKDGCKGGKRQKSCVEKRRPKKRIKEANLSSQAYAHLSSQASAHLSSQASAQDYSPETTQELGGLNLFCSLLTNLEEPRDLNIMDHDVLGM